MAIAWDCLMPIATNRIAFLDAPTLAFMVAAPDTVGTCSTEGCGQDAMFEELRFLGKTEKSIALATSKGNAIPNLVEIDPDAKAVANYQRLLREHGVHWQPRKPATGVYNCAGMVWASRRTSILEPSAWQKIIDDDGYRWLPKDQLPMPGDIAAYVDLENEELLHVARVAYLAPGVIGGSEIPMVVSKWNSTAGESIHRAFDVPYRKWGFNYDLCYLTDRKG